jgi:hypothetical protein
MWSTIRMLFAAAFAAIVAVMILPSLAFADDPAGAEPDRSPAGQVIGFVRLPKPATETITGVVTRVDERNDTIKVRRSPQTTEELKVQDGLLFNAVRYGDHVEVTVENIDGTKTILGLLKR